MFMARKEKICSDRTPISIDDVESENEIVKHFVGGAISFGAISREAACNAGDLGLIPGSGRSPGEGNGNPLQYSCLENPMDREAWQTTVHGIAKSRT